jgi:hypothetical protein
VLLAGPGVPGDSLLALQGAALMKAAGQRDSLAIWNRRLQRKLFATAKAAKDTVGLEAPARDHHAQHGQPPGRGGPPGPAFVKARSR